MLSLAAHLSVPIIMPAIDARKDYYALLQLQVPRPVPHQSHFIGGQPELATEIVPVKDIKSAYYRLAKLFHPDKTGGDEQAAEHFKKVLEAYEVLSDPVTRQRYHGLRAQVTAAQAAADAAMAAQKAQAFHATQNSEDGAWNVGGNRANQYRDQADQKQKTGANKGRTFWPYPDTRQWQPPPRQERQQAKAEKEKGRPQHQRARAERQGAQSNRHDPSLIRPEQVGCLPPLNPQEKQQYASLVRRCWEDLNTMPAGEQRYNEAYQTLLQTSKALMQGMKNYQQAQSQRVQAESHPHRAGGPNSKWSHMTPEDFARPPPQQRPEEPTPASDGPPDPTSELPEDLDFSAFTFDHYFDSNFREKPFLRLWRANVDEGRHELRKTRVMLHVARTNVLKFGAPYVRTMESIRYEAELRERETWEVRWKEELERREQWLKAHEEMAKLRRGVERMRIFKERQAEEARKRVVEQERENVKMKAQGGKVEVIELDDSDEDSLFGAPFDVSQEDELLGDTTIGTSL